jgi:hypothetical protein
MLVCVHLEQHFMAFMAKSWEILITLSSSFVFQSSRFMVETRLEFYVLHRPLVYMVVTARREPQTS